MTYTDEEVARPIKRTRTVYSVGEALQFEAELCRAAALFQARAIAMRLGATTPAHLTRPDAGDAQEMKG